MKITELKIYTPNLSNQIDFYSKTLGLKLINSSLDKASILVGDSILQLESRNNSTPYHFAFNIPSNKIKESLAWLKLRVHILKNGENEIQHSKDWNSDSIYFYDNDKNILELIARNNLNNPTDEDFNHSQLLNISEIGIATSNIKKEFESISSFVKLEIYNGGFDRFCAIGDEDGLFICIDKNIKDWFPTNDKAYSSEFSLKFKEANSTFELEYKNEKIDLSLINKPI